MSSAPDLTSSDSYRTSVMPAGGLRGGVTYSIDSIGGQVSTANLNGAPKPKTLPIRRSTLWLLGVLGTLLLAGCVALGVIVYLHHRHEAAADQAAKSTDGNAVKAHLTASVSAAAASAASLPYKYAVSNVPPRKSQYLRGTCYLFALVGLIEHQYRLQGLSHGWLQPDEYVEFSEQAFGYKTIQFCAKNQQLCLPDGVAFNHTEGGDLNLLYSFRNQFKNALLPASVCPYVKDFGPTTNDCDNAPAAIARNPIQVEVTGYRYYLDIPSIKQALSQSSHALGLRIPMHYSYRYLPCDHPLAASSTGSIYAGACPAPASLDQPCPDAVCPQNFRSKCCIRVVEDAWSFTGEFRGRVAGAGAGAMVEDDSHTVLLTGYNDEYSTESGLTGGFIVRNSWMDSAFTSLAAWPDGVGKATRARGSHSMAYFMSQISAADERLMCPNSADPRNWFTVWSLSGALHPGTLQCANASIQPLHLRCVSLGGVECKLDSDTVYFAMGFTETDDGLFSGKFLEYNTASKESRTFILPPRVLDTFAWVFLPFENETRTNDPDMCGYHFWPYELMRVENAKAPGVYALDYELSFAPQSYLANAARFKSAQYDYSYLIQSTHKQKSMPAFDDVFPNALVSGAAADKEAAAPAQLKSALAQQQQQQAQQTEAPQPHGGPVPGVYAYNSAQHPIDAHQAAIGLPFGRAAHAHNAAHKMKKSAAVFEPPSMHRGSRRPVV